MAGPLEGDPRIGYPDALAAACFLPLCDIGMTFRARGSFLVGRGWQVVDFALRLACADFRFGIGMPSLVVDRWS